MCIRKNIEGEGNIRFSKCKHVNRLSKEIKRCDTFGAREGILKELIDSHNHLLKPDKD